MSTASSPQRIASSPRGMVSTAHPGATDAGVEILAEGGNAVDAAVASAFALGVCEPQASGLGGQTMMLVHLVDPRRNIALDGSSRAPMRASVDRFARKEDRKWGYRASTVPSTPAVLAYAAGKFGRLPLARLLEPAVRLADQGVRITALQRRLQEREEEPWASGNAAPLFRGPEGAPLREGTLFRQPALAETLRTLASRGIEDFYRGEIAARIEEDMIAHEGLIRLDDLANVPWPLERRPLSARFDGLRVLTFPPPGAGRTLVEMLNILSFFPAKDRDVETPRGASLLAEVIRRVQLDRRDRPFDPNFYPQVENKRMTSAEYAKLVGRQVRARLKAKKPSEPLGPTDGLGEGVAETARGETTHLSVIDGEGNVVGLTQSIEGIYGSLCATADLGFLYNDYMNAFEYKDLSHPYYLRPNGVPWASVAPTVVFRGRRPWLVLGSPGSERITSAILQVFLRLLEGRPLQAVASPRLHCSASGRVTLEGAWMRDDIPPELAYRGFKVRLIEPFSFYLGCVQLVVRRGKTLVGVADPRRDGEAKGCGAVR